MCKVYHDLELIEEIKICKGADVAALKAALSYYDPFWLYTLEPISELG